MSQGVFMPNKFNARLMPVPEPYFLLPLGSRSMRCLFRFQLGAHTLPNEMGRRLHIARVVRLRPFRPGMHLGDERHYVFKCPTAEDMCAVIPGSLMTFMGPCACSCGIPIRRMLHLACYRILI